jgi:hypothetical protein
MGAQVGLTLGAVFLIMGLGSGNSGIWMMGLILLGIGVVSYRRLR